MATDRIPNSTLLVLKLCKSLFERHVGLFALVGTIVKALLVFPLVEHLVSFVDHRGSLSQSGAVVHPVPRVAAHRLIVWLLKCRLSLWVLNQTCRVLIRLQVAAVQGCGEKSHRDRALASLNLGKPGRVAFEVRSHEGRMAFE